MILKQDRSVIRLTIKRKNLFNFNTQTLLDKSVLSKRRGKPTYLCSKNLQIRLWYQMLGHVSNIKVVKVSKLNDRVDIIVKKGQEKSFFF